MDKKIPLLSMTDQGKNWKGYIYIYKEAYYQWKCWQRGECHLQEGCGRPCDVCSTLEWAPSIALFASLLYPWQVEAWTE